MATIRGTVVGTTTSGAKATSSLSGGLSGFPSKTVAGAVVGTPNGGASSHPPKKPPQEAKTEEIAPASRARTAAQYGRVAELEELFDAGLFGPNDRDDEGCTVLQWAAINNRGAVVDMLLEERGADPNMSGGVLDENALQWAVRQGHVAAVVSLREAGCSATHKGVEGANAAHLACRYGKHVVLAYLLARDEVNEDASGGLAVVVDGDRHPRRGGGGVPLVDVPDDRGRTPLMICVEWYWSGSGAGHLDALRVVLAFGASPTFAEREGRKTALHLAAERNLDAHALSVLVEAGGAWALDAEDADGRTPEQAALAAGNFRAAGLLKSLAASDVCSMVCRRRRHTRGGSSSSSASTSSKKSGRCGAIDGCRRSRAAAAKKKGLRSSGRGPLLCFSANGGPLCTRDRTPSDGDSGDDEYETRDSDDFTADGGVLESKGGGGEDTKEQQEALLADHASATNGAAIGVHRKKNGGPHAPQKTKGGVPPMTRVAACYGMLAPTVGGVALAAAVRHHGWLVGAACLPVVPVLLTALAPSKASRWGMCGFAAGSIALIVASYGAYHFDAAVPTAVTACYVALVAGLVLNFSLAVLKDPGVVDPPRREKVCAIVRLARSKRLAKTPFCATCLVEKPPRSKHDPTLGKCVRRFDHFCPYIANVVGEGNYLYFYLFLGFVVAAISLHLVVVLPKVALSGAACAAPSTSHRRAMLDAAAARRSSSRRSSSGSSSRGVNLRGAAAASVAPSAGTRSSFFAFEAGTAGPPWCLVDPANAPLLLATLLACLHLTWVTALFCVHTNLVCRDTTTYETMRSAHTAGASAAKAHADASGATLLAHKKADSSACVGATNARNALCGPPDREAAAGKGGDATSSTSVP